MLGYVVNPAKPSATQPVMLTRTAATSAVTAVRRRPVAASQMRSGHMKSFATTTAQAITAATALRSRKRQRAAAPKRMSGPTVPVEIAVIVVIGRSAAP